MGSKPKKPYYLKEYLHFILPYLKPYINSGKTNSIQTKLENTAADSEFSIHSEDLQIDDYVENEDTFVDTVRTSALIDEDDGSIDLFTSSDRKRRRSMTEVEQSIVNYLDSKRKKIENNSKETAKSEDCDAARYFLLSLLPDMASMTHAQQRFFRIKVMTLIDEIHSNFEQCKSNHLNASTIVQK
ncbi:unnamed protein product [Acanthoscelides obtectus]|nr:unnamed protein product [Acanthoscelides obtectus]CAK1624675.1 hypothetical protein AOBTE_LOCUS2688 [Acanthoscelides obtectus]